MKKIVITGAECSGKSTLATGLGNYYKTPVLTEYAREYLEDLNRPYSERDLELIAHAQKKREERCRDQDMPFVICDTSFLVLKVWSEVKYKSVSPVILRYLDQSPADLYLLPHFDIPYEPDTLREHPNDRRLLYQLYLTELGHQSAPWVALKGDPASRLRKAIKNIDALITIKS